MSTAKRAYDLMRGYLNREVERLRGFELSDAERELNEGLEGPGFGANSQEGPASHRARAVHLDSAQARQVLGVSESADFAEIRSAYDRISKRTDPANFPTGSLEATQAGEIHRLVHRAYTLLTEKMDSTEKRFRSLEID